MSNKTPNDSFSEKSPFSIHIAFTMTSIPYRQLNSSAGEIRLLTILPESYSLLTSPPTSGGTAPAQQAGHEFDSNSNDPWDNAVSQLVEMGYPAAKARQALTESEAGIDISAAIEWLTFDAQWEMRRKAEEGTARSEGRAKKTQEADTDGRSPSGVLVECILETVSSESNPAYTALSYTWGSPLLCKPIRIDGMIVQVRASLEEALRHVRQPSQPVCLWVDVICIDQNNTKERSEQILRMRSIYEKAVLVIAWLGLAADGSDAAIDVLDVVGREAIAAGILKIRSADFHNCLKPGADRHEVAIKELLDGIAQKAGVVIPDLPIKCLSERKYWNRIWIIQEVCVARNVTFVCGSKRLSFSNFAPALMFITAYHVITMADRMRALASINPADFLDPVKVPALAAKLNAYKAEQDNYVEGPDSAASILFGTRYRYQAEIGSPETLVEILRRECVGNKSSMGQRVTDPRDIIYGILGLASDNEKLEIEPDYSKNTEQIYTEVTRRLIEHGNILILSWCQHPRSLEGMPSWVPDFSSRIRNPCGDERRCKLFSASGKQQLKKPHIHSSPENLGLSAKILKLACIRVDTIMNIGNAWNTNPDDSFDFTAADKFLQDISMFCLRGRMSKMMKRFRERDFKTPFDKAASSCDKRMYEEGDWRIPCGDLERKGSERRRASTFIKVGYDELRKWIADQSVSHMRTQSHACEAYKLAMGDMHNRRPFLSPDGYVGLVPTQAQVDDLVCIVAGADVPFVFRKLPDGGQKQQQQQQCYQLIGEAYVHGIMDGEFVASGAEPETLCIC
jgi:hypothetical protein